MLVERGHNVLKEEVKLISSFFIHDIFKEIRSVY